jgi:hypothetical protein
MSVALTTRLRTLSSTELTAGVAAALIVSGVTVRFLGPSIFLPAVNLLRSASDQTLTLMLEAFGLLEIVAGIGLLVWVTAQVRRRSHLAANAELTEPKP